MTSWRESWHYDGVGYSPTVLNTRFRRSNHYYYGLYERYSDIRHYRYLRELTRQDGFAIDYCTQDDVAHGRVLLEDYRLVLLGSHAEFTTLNCFSALPRVSGEGRSGHHSRRGHLRRDFGLPAQRGRAALHLAAGSCVDA